MNEPLVEIRRNSREVLRVSTSAYKGNVYADVRIWYEPREGGDYQASGKGVSLKPEQIADVITALTKAQVLLSGDGHAD